MSPLRLLLEAPPRSIPLPWLPPELLSSFCRSAMCDCGGLIRAINHVSNNRQGLEELGVFEKWWFGFQSPEASVLYQSACCYYNKTPSGVLVTAWPSVPCSILVKLVLSLKNTRASDRGDYQSHNSGGQNSKKLTSLQRIPDYIVMWWRNEGYVQKRVKCIRWSCSKTVQSLKETHMKHDSVT